MIASAPGALGARDGDGHAAVLEAAGRVRALELEIGLGADPLGEPRRVDQRRRALVQGHDRIAGLERQVVAVALDQRAWHQLSHELFLDHADRARRRAQEAELGDLLHRGLEALLADRVHDHDQLRLLAHRRAGRRSAPRPRCRRAPRRPGRARRARRRPRGGGRRPLDVLGDLQLRVLLEQRRAARRSPRRRRRAPPTRSPGRRRRDRTS